MHQLLYTPWPWYIAGPLLGLMVPTLLLAGNKHFGISANLRHLCAACVPSNISFFSYDWKKEQWNLYFAIGIMAGAMLAAQFSTPIPIHPLLTMGGKGILLLTTGGFLVGFGSRYAGGCTSGHAIMGLSDLQWPSLVATIMFMTGGFIMTYFWNFI